MRISECEFKPINFTVENNGLGLNQDFIDEPSGTLLEFQFPAPDQRIQFELSTQIIQKFQNTYKIFSSNYLEIKCDERFNYKYDGVFINNISRIGLEVQFRSDFLKDITRFQLGFNSGIVHTSIFIQNLLS